MFQQVLVAVLFAWALSGTANGDDYLVFNIGTSIKKINMARLVGPNSRFNNQTDVEQVLTDPVPKATITAMAYDCETKRVAYAVNHVGIFQVGLDGRDRRMVVGDNKQIYGMAIDWIKRNLYWTEQSPAQIMIAPITPSPKSRTLINLENSPAGIVAIPKRNLLIWSYLVKGRLEMSDLAGQNRKLVAGDTSRLTPFGFAVNSDGNKLFWTNEYIKEIGSGNIADLPGGQLKDPRIDFVQHQKSYRSDQIRSSGIAEWKDTLFWRTLEDHKGACIFNHEADAEQCKIDNVERIKTNKDGVASVIVETVYAPEDVLLRYTAITVATGACPR